ncbi:sulfhydryl oxidase 2 isoform X2 [Phacochoerus africanus]|uniref:sulfhydryl oxidase 2 isoform X2 n=1 Tax=Phacochoerus africanus TaxID=41426 RepID=UPI001FD8FC27|nr:sulfhydryl oxidase 2 isoform X2 [Phacochoerus africanus]
MAAAGTAASAARSPGAPAGMAARVRRPPAARPARLSALLVLLAAAAGPGAGGAARLYRAGEDAVWVLDSGSLRGATANSSAAWLVQFYSSWCGHCIGYAPTWRALADDVRDWAAAVRVAALDCAEEKNHEVCRAYDVRFYPTFRYFKAFTKDFTTGENYKGPDRELRTVRQAMIDFLQNHTDEGRPPACPPLGPIRPSDLLSLVDSPAGRYVAVLFESDGSYLGREVILDLIPYEHISVRRALGSDSALLAKLGLSSLPSCYLIYPNGSHGPVTVGKPLRSFFSSYLKSLPGVRRKSLLSPEKPDGEEDSGTVAWREFDRSKLYTADLESALHQLLRVELAAHKALAGAELQTLKDFATVLAKLFPGRPPVRKLLETLQEWLASLPLDRIPYNAVLDLVNNKMRISGLYLTRHVQWVGCQGSRAELRGYPCSLWKLFHTLTVRAGTHPDALDGTGHPSEDPKFPKVPWPTPDLCPACHEEIRGLPSWNEGQVLLFLKQHYGSDNLVDTYSEDLGGTGEGAPAEGEGPERGRASPGQPRGAPGAQGLRVPSELLPGPHLSERWRQGPAAGLGSLSGAEGQEGRRGAEAAAAAAAFLGLGFSSLDMSLCVLLYVASSLFLMGMCCFFRLRSKRWKVRLHHPSV